MQLLIIMSLMTVLLIFGAHHMYYCERAASTVHYLIRYEQYHQLMLGLLTYAHVLLHDNKTLFYELKEKKELLLRPEFSKEYADIEYEITYRLASDTMINVIAQLKKNNVIVYQQKMNIKIDTENPLCTTPFYLLHNA